MSAITGLTLSVTNTSTLTGGANITGTCNTNQLNIINNSSFSQSGSGTFSTGTGSVTLNGTVICSSTSSFTGLATFNGSILLPSGKTLTLPTGRVISNSNDVVDTTSGQTVAGVKTFSNQIVANGGINAGSNSITCGSLTCSSETDSGVLTVNGMLNANGGITVPANQNLSISRKVSGFQQKVWNCNDLGLSSNPSSRYLLIAQNGALSSYGNNFGVLTLKGQIGIENGAVTNIIFFDIQIGTRGSVSTNGYVNSYYSLSNITSYLDFIVTSTSPGNNFYLYLKSSAYFMFEFVAGGNEYSSTPLLNEPTSTGATFASGETVVVSSVINNVATSNSSNFYYGTSSITCGSLTCSSENDTGTLTVGGLLTANNGIFIANNKSISTNDTGGALLFTGLGFSSTYTPNTGYGLGLTMNQNSNGEVSLFSLRNNIANTGGFSFYDYYTTIPSKTLLATLNTSTGLTTNNLPINAGTGTITCGSINTSSILANNNCNVYFPSSLPTTSNNSGLGLLWNVTSGLTDTAFLAYGQGGAVPGFTFYSVYMGANTRSLLATIGAGGSSFNTSLTANGGLTIPSGQTLTVNGTLVVPGTYSPTSITTSGLITANGGITVGSNQNITLASTVTTPTSGQLGYTITGTNTLGSITSGTSTNWSSISLPVGTWLLRGKVSATASGGTVTVASVGSNLAPASSGTLSVSNNTSSITTGLTVCLATETNIVNVASTTVYYWYGFITFSGGSLTTASTTGGIGSSTYFTATRIA